MFYKEEREDHQKSCVAPSQAISLLTKSEAFEMDPVDVLAVVDLKKC